MGTTEVSQLSLASLILRPKPETRPLQDFLAGQVSQATRQAYRRDATQFFRWLRGQYGEVGEGEITREEVQGVTVQDVIAWRNWLIESGVRPTTVNRKLSAIRSFFQFLVALRVIERSPAEAKIVRGMKVSQSTPTNSLTVEEIRAILRVIDEQKNPVVRLRDRALILLLVYGGLRRSEAANVHREDIQMKDSHWILRIPEAKGGSDQWVKLQPVVVEAIEKYLEALSTITSIMSHNSMPIFVGFSNCQQERIEPLQPRAINRIVKRHARKAGITKPVSAHSCRHSTASLAIAAGAQPHKVQAHLRHRSITTTMRYVHDREALESNASDFIRV